MTIERAWKGVYCGLDKPVKKCAYAELNGECHQAYCPYQTDGNTAVSSPELDKSLDRIEWLFNDLIEDGNCYGSEYCTPECGCESGYNGCLTRLILDIINESRNKHKERIK